MQPTATQDITPQRPVMTPAESPHRRKQPLTRLSRNPAVMVRSADANPLSTPLGKRRRAYPISHSPSRSPHARTSEAASNLSTLPSAERRRRSSSASPSDGMDLDSDDIGRTSADSDDIEITAVAHPERPMSAFPGFRPGNLVKVHMKKFLTFTDTIIYPGPRMNLILGPNGTGKSTVCNAVCIVFAGNPKILGRSTDLGAFVKHGENSAEIEAHVYDPSARSGARKVKRVFDAEGKGTFFIDDKKAKMSDVVSKINKRYDIQLDNLSQFMPQEKIAEFTQLRQDELLAITVRSLGGSERESQFQQISKMDQALGSETQGLRQNENKLAELEAQHEAEEAEVEAYKQQQEAKDRLEVYKLYLPTAQAAELKNTYITLLQGRKEVEDQLQELRNRLNQASTGPINRIEQELGAVMASVTASKTRCKRADQTSNALVRKSDDVCMTLSNKSKMLEDAEHDAERRRKGIEQAEMKLAKFEEELQDGDDGMREEDEEQRVQDLREQRSRIRSEMTAEMTRKGPLEQQRQNAARSIKHYNDRLRRIGDVRQERIRMLGERYRTRQLVDCDKLVKDMSAQHAFRGRVCGPVAAEIEVKNEYHARIMESCAAGFLATAFVTESARDSRLLIAECKRKFSGWAPDIISAPTTADDQLDEHAIDSQVPRRGVDRRLRELGIECMVDEIYECPKSVRAALNAQAGLHLIHVGNQRAEGCKEQLRLEEGVDSWFTPRSRCAVIRSRYDRNVRSLKVETQFANYTGATYSTSVQHSQQQKERYASLIREEEGKLAGAGNELKNIDSRCAELQESLREVETAQRDVMQRRNARRARRERVERARQNVKDLRRRAASLDVQREKSKLESEIRDLEEEAIQAVETAVNGMQELRNSLVMFDDQIKKRTDITRRLNLERSKNAELEEQIRETEGQADGARKLSRKARDEWKKTEAKADRYMEQVDKAKHDALLKDLDGKSPEWVESQIAQQSGVIDGLQTGQNLIQRYELRQRKIDKLKREIESERSHHQRKMESLRRQKAEFLAWLETGIEKMRSKFSALYRRLGCAGDLELINKDSESIADLRLQILVSYRSNAELRPISTTANSGGEKMCCTMLFCFSLQQEEERMPPFVFVDELNQGLDPTNEMKIMTMMFEDAEKEIAPQSFVITPKILMNLPFHSQTKTHIVFNGSVSGKQDITAPHLG